VSDGAACASRAAFGSLLRRSSKVVVVNILAPAGWMIVLEGSWRVATLDGAVGVSKETFAAESTNAVESRFVGLLQPESEEM